MDSKLSQSVDLLKAVVIGRKVVHICLDFQFRRTELPLDCLVCNAAVYLPTAKEPRFTADGFEISVGTNHLGHFLLANLLLEDLKKRKQTASQAPRMVIVGSITGNSNTVAGKPLENRTTCPSDFGWSKSSYEMDRFPFSRDLYRPRTDLAKGQCFSLRRASWLLKQ